MDSIKNRRSIRRFEERKVEGVKLEKILRAAMQAPSAGNQRPWEFLVVAEPEKREKLSQMSPYAKAITSAPVSLVLLANEGRLNFPENWQQDMGACAQNILLQAVEEGLGGVWLGVAPLEERMSYVSKLFDLADHLIPFCVIPLGYPAEGQENCFIDRWDESRVHYEAY